MKLKHLFFNALAVISFAACSSEAEEIKPAEKASTATLQLDMTGQYGTGNSDQTRTLSLDGTEYPRFIHEEGVTDWKTHCFIRNEAGTVQFYALVDWNATTDSDGNISLHIKNSKLELQNSAGSDVTATETLPKAGERWYIAGIAGGGVLDAAKSNVTYSANSALEGTLKSHQVRVPLAFGWTPFTIPANTERAPQIVVQFQPQGTLFSVYVNNKTNPLKGPLTSVLVAETNAFSRRGYFDYSLTATRAENTSAPAWTWVDEGSHIVNLREVSMEANKAENVYFWAMPRTTVPTEGFSTTFWLDGFTTYAEGTTNAPATKSKQYEAGKTYMEAGLDVGPIIHFWEFLTPYNVAPDGQSFVTTSANDVSGYWTWQEAMNKFSTITIDGVRYSLPITNQWRTIVPSWYGSGNGFIRFNLATAENNKKESLSGSGMGREYISSYRGSLNNEAYALRFWTESGDYSRLTAVRYQYVDNPVHTAPATPQKILKVTFRYLGPTASATTVDEIANTAYWESNTENDVTFGFPASGRYNANMVPEYGGTTGFFWSQSNYTLDEAWGMSFSDKDARTDRGLKGIRQSVRLFKVKP